MTISRISRLIYENMGTFYDPNTVIYFTFGILISYLILKEHFLRVVDYQKLSQM